MTYENALEVLKKYGQEHVLAYYDELNDEEKQSLLSQIEEIDFSIFDVLKEKESAGKEETITPTEALTLDTIKEYEFAYNGDPERTARSCYACRRSGHQTGV